jgi:hypothetical protein
MAYFDNLKLDRWFKAVTYLSGIILLLSLTVEIQVFSNELLSAIGSGGFLYGIGRWKNTKTKNQFIPGGKLSWEERDKDIIGVVLEFLGVILLLVAAGSIIRTSLTA